MAEAVADGCWDMLEVSNAARVSGKCSSCETELSTLKTRFICQTCQPDEKDHYLCPFCVVLHVRKSHQVTDQNYALVEVCEKDNNVAMFLCKTCDLKMFCYACFKDHCTHDFAECSECTDEMKQIVGRVHESLSRSDAIYKRAAKSADIAKTTERRLSDVCEIFNSDYIKRDVEKIWIEVLNERTITDEVAANRKTLEKMGEHVQLLNNCVQKVGDSQVELRSMLSSSLMRLVRRYSDGDLTNLERKQNQPNVLIVPKATDRDVEDYRKNLDGKRAILIEQLRPLVLEYVRNFKFSKLVSLEIDLNDLAGEFNQLELPLECTEVRIARSKFGLLLACRDGDQFSVYRISDSTKDAQFLQQVPADNLWLAGVGNYECIAVYPVGPYTINVTYSYGMNSIKTRQRNGNHSQLVGLFSCPVDGFNSVIVHGSTGNWMLILAINNVNMTEFLVEKPYSFDCILPQQHLMCLVFISGGQVFLLNCNPISFAFGTAQLEVPCRESGDEHHGKFECGFFEDHLRPTRILFGVWCLQCKVLEVWGSDEDQLGRGDSTSKFERELRVSIPVLDMKQVAFFGKKCFVVSTNNTVQYCGNIYQIL